MSAPISMPVPTREEQGRALLWQVFQAPAHAQGEALLRLIEAAIRAAQERK